MYVCIYIYIYIARVYPLSRLREIISGAPSEPTKAAQHSPRIIYIYIYIHISIVIVIVLVIFIVIQTIIQLYIYISHTLMSPIYLRGGQRMASLHLAASTSFATAASTETLNGYNLGATFARGTKHKQKPSLAAAGCPLRARDPRRSGRAAYVAYH